MASNRIGVPDLLLLSACLCTMFRATWAGFRTGNIWLWTPSATLVQDLCGQEALKAATAAKTLLRSIGQTLHELSSRFTQDLLQVHQNIKILYLYLDTTSEHAKNPLRTEVISNCMANLDWKGWQEGLCSSLRWCRITLAGTDDGLVQWRIDYSLFALPICYPAPICLFSISFENSQDAALEHITLGSIKLLGSAGGKFTRFYLILLFGFLKWKSWPSFHQMLVQIREITCEVIHIRFAPPYLFEEIIIFHAQSQESRGRSTQHKYDMTIYIYYSYIYY